MEGILDNSDVELHGTIMYGGVGVDVLRLAADAETPHSEPDMDLSEDDIARILYTTVAPKGTVLSHRALMAEYVSCITDLEYRHEERALHSLPFSATPRCTSS